MQNQVDNQPQCDAQVKNKEVRLDTTVEVPATYKEKNNEPQCDEQNLRIRRCLKRLTEQVTHYQSFKLQNGEITAVLTLKKSL